MNTDILFVHSNAWPLKIKSPHLGGVTCALMWFVRCFKAVHVWPAIGVISLEKLGEHTQSRSR